MISEQIPDDLKAVIEFHKRQESNDFPTTAKRHYEKILRESIDGEPLIKEGDTIYEIGTGIGAYLGELSKAIGPLGRYFGIDIYPEKLSIAKKKIADLKLDNIEIFFGDGRDLSKTPLKYECADTVLIFGVLSSLDNASVLKIIDESIKAIKPDGKIIVDVIAKEYFEASCIYHNVKKSTTDLVKDGIMPLGDNLFGTLFSKKYIKKLFGKRGFSVKIESRPNEDIDLSNALNDPEYIRKLPAEHYLIAKRIK